MSETTKKFEENLKKSIDYNGIWQEASKEEIILALSLTIKKEILRDWGITDIQQIGDEYDGSKYLYKMEKRLHSLSDEELKKRYGI